MAIYTLKHSPTEVARLFLYVREILQNKGNRVEAIQKWGGGSAGDSWCCWWATMILDICFQGLSPIPRGGKVQDVYSLARRSNWLVKDPQKDDIFIYVDDNDHAHHIGFVTEVNTGIAANTSEDGQSSNGDRVAEHTILSGPHVKYIRYPKQ